MHELLALFKDIPGHLQIWAESYGTGLYIILFLIIFAETGLVIAPLLPGDSLLFAAGAVLSLKLPNLNVYTTAVILTIAAILGDTLNYHVGKWMAPRLFKESYSKWLNPQHLVRAQEFYNKHGGKAIVLSRFMPIIRTYAPFVAGMSQMNYKSFLGYNAIGGVIWVNSFLFLGYFFGNIPAIKSNFQYVIIAIVVLSFAPIAYEYIKMKRARA